MEAVGGLLILLLFIFFIVGMFKPSLVLWWEDEKKANRWYVFVTFYLFSSIVLSIVDKGFRKDGIIVIPFFFVILVMMILRDPDEILRKKTGRKNKKNESSDVDNSSNTDVPSPKEILLDITKEERIKNGENKKYIINNRKICEKTLARNKLNFMDFDEMWQLDGFEFEDYFSEQLDGLAIKNKTLPKSGDFGIDTLVYANQDYAVQLKHYKVSTVGVSAIQEAFTGAMYYGDMVPVVLTTGRYTKPAIKLAEEINVELINRKDIKEWHNIEYKRSNNHIENGLYRYVQNNIKIDNKINRRRITIILEDKNLTNLNIYRNDYIQIAEAMFPELNINLEFVKNEESLDIFPLVRGNINNIVKEKIVELLKHPILSSLYKSKRYK